LPLTESNQSHKNPQIVQQRHTIPSYYVTSTTTICPSTTSGTLRYGSDLGAPYLEVPPIVLVSKYCNWYFTLWEDHVAPSLRVQGLVLPQVLLVAGTALINLNIAEGKARTNITRNIHYYTYNYSKKFGPFSRSLSLVLVVKIDLIFRNQRKSKTVNTLYV
jgi:hypothetical protein